MTDDMRMIKESKPEPWGLWKPPVAGAINLDVKPTFMENKMSNESKYGIDNIKAMIDETAKAWEVGKEIAADGINLSDIFAVPKVVSILLRSYQRLPSTKKELGDLQADEIYELINYAGATFLIALYGDDFLKKIKK